MQQKPQIKQKPWGQEVWFAESKNFAGKVLYLNAGHRYSLQYHERKEETQYLFSGKIEFTLGTDSTNLQTIILNPGDKIDILPYTWHRAKALEDSIIFEVSTPDLDDVVKIEDDYGRSGKGNDEDLDKALANS